MDSISIVSSKINITSAAPKFNGHEYHLLRTISEEKFLKHACIKGPKQRGATIIKNSFGGYVTFQT